MIVRLPSVLAHARLPLRALFPRAGLTAARAGFSSTSRVLRPDVDEQTGELIPDPGARIPLSIQANYHQPLRRRPTHGFPVCDLQLRAFSVRNLEFMCDFALRAAYYAHLPASGPVPMPKKIERWTVPRSNFVHKKSQENFERITHKRLIQIVDGHPETVELWLAFLRQHQFYGVGMKANVFAWDEVGVGKKMGVSLETLRDVPRPKWAHFGPRRNVETAEKVRQILTNPKYHALALKSGSSKAFEEAVELQRRGELGEESAVEESAADLFAAEDRTAEESVTEQEQAEQAASIVENATRGQQELSRTSTTADLPILRDVDTEPSAEGKSRYQNILEQEEAVQVDSDIAKQAEDAAEAIAVKNSMFEQEEAVQKGVKASGPQEPIRHVEEAVKQVEPNAREETEASRENAMEQEEAVQTGLKAGDAPKAARHVDEVQQFERSREAEAHKEQEIRREGAARREAEAARKEADLARKEAELARRELEAFRREAELARKELEAVRKESQAAKAAHNSEAPPKQVEQDISPQLKQEKGVQRELSDTNSSKAIPQEGTLNADGQTPEAVKEEAKAAHQNIVEQEEIIQPDLNVSSTFERNPQADVLEASGNDSKAADQEVEAINQNILEQEAVRSDLNASAVSEPASEIENAEQFMTDSQKPGDTSGAEATHQEIVEQELEAVPSISDASDLVQQMEDAEGLVADGQKPETLEEAEAIHQNIVEQEESGRADLLPKDEKVDKEK